MTCHGHVHWYVIYDENLNETVVTNLYEYGRQNNISQNTLSSVRKKIKRNTQIPCTRLMH